MPTNHSDTHHSNGNGRHLQVDHIESIPSALKDLPQWVLWKIEKRRQRDGTLKPTKVPYNPRYPQEKACANLPSTWGAYRTAVRLYRADPVRWGGIGFEFTPESGIFGVDLDHVYDPTTREWLDWSDEFLAKCEGRVPAAPEIIANLATYAEFSPSRTGVHILCRGSLPEDCTRNKMQASDCAFEIYRRARFFTVTGDRCRGPRNIMECSQAAESLYRLVFPPPPIIPDVPPLRRIGALSDDQIINTMRAKSLKGTRLWDGNIDGYPLGSEADMALASILAFYAGPDRDLIIHLMRRSGLARGNPRKFAREDYLPRTVNVALAGKTEFYDWGPRHRLVDLTDGQRRSLREARKAVYDAYFRRNGNA